jgi:hypothetical protein
VCKDTCLLPAGPLVLAVMSVPSVGLVNSTTPRVNTRVSKT